MLSPLAEGMTFQSQKYGNISNWRPDRREFESDTYVYTYITHFWSDLILDLVVCASVAEAADTSYSHVILTTKVIPELEKTPDLLSPFLRPSYSDRFLQPIYVLLQNGLNIEADLRRALKELRPSEEPKVIGASVYIGTRCVSKTLVEHSYFVSWTMGAI